MNAIWQTEEYRDLIGRRTASVSNYEPVTNAIQLEGSSDTTDLVFQDGYQLPVLSIGGLPFNHVFDTNYNTKTHVKYVTTIGSTTYTIDDSAIKQFDYEEKSITGNRFTFGDFVSRVSTFTAIDTEGLYSSVSFDGASGHLYLGVEKTDGSVFWIDYGTFYVVDCKKTYSTLWLSISDSRSLFNKTITSVTTTKTVFEMCQEVCTQAGVTLGTTTAQMPNYSVTIMNAASIANKSLAQVVSYLAQSIGAFAIIGKDDKLYFKWYAEVTPICSLPASNINANMTVADYDVSVTGATWVDIDGVSHTIGTTGYVAKVEGNPFQFANYDLLLYEMSYRILGTTYTPITLKYIGNPAIEVGDIVIASDGRGNAYSLPVTSIYISNLMSQEIRSAGESHVTTTNTNVSTSVAIEVAKQEAIAYAKYAEIIADRITSGTLDASLITVINMIAQTLTNSADADFYATIGDIDIDGSTFTGILGYLKSFSTTVPIFKLVAQHDDYHETTKLHISLPSGAYINIDSSIDGSDTIANIRAPSGSNYSESYLYSSTGGGVSDSSELRYYNGTTLHGIGADATGAFKRTGATKTYL
jgi:hypothetical protein